MSIPAIIVISLQAIQLLISANQHGIKKTKTTNFWTTLWGTALMSGLLYVGGFFN
jgi:hypothetical protein